MSSDNSEGRGEKRKGGNDEEQVGKLVRRDLFTLLDHDSNKEESRIEFDGNAVIAELRRDPKAARERYMFSESCTYPLHQAISLGAPLDVVEALYESYPDAIKDTKRNRGRTVFHLCCKYNTSLEVLSCLFEKWPDGLEGKDWDGNTPLHLACECNPSNELIEWLLEKRPDDAHEERHPENALGGMRYSRHDDAPVHLYLSRKSPLKIDLKLVSSLVEIYSHCVEISDGEFYYTPLHHACKLGAPIDVIRLVLEKLPDAAMVTDHDYRTPLHHACESNSSSEVIALLLEEGPDAVDFDDKEYQTPLHIACFSEEVSLEIITLLLEKAPQCMEWLDGMDQTPLDLAYSSEFVSLEQFSWLLKKCPEDMKVNLGTRAIDGWWTTPLHHACKDKDVSLEKIDLLIKRWPEAIKVKDHTRSTPLHIACARNLPLEIISLLVERWPEATGVVDKNWLTPLHYSFRNLHPLEIISLLAEKWPKEEYKPLHIACAYNLPLEIISLLVGKYPDGVKIRGDFGRTPLHLACMNNHRSEVCSFLMQRWPDAVKVKDYEGETPLHLACRRNSLKLITLLLEKWPNAVQAKNRLLLTPSAAARSAGNNGEDFKRKIELIFASVSRLCGHYLSGETAAVIIQTFLQVEWIGGMAILLDKHPSSVQELGIGDNSIPTFLSFVGHKCKLLTLWKILRNRQDLLCDIQE